MESPRDIESLSPIPSVQREFPAPDRRSPSPPTVDSPSPIDEIDPELRELYNFEAFNPSSRPSSLCSQDAAEFHSLARDERDSIDSSAAAMADHSNSSDASTIAVPKPLDETKSLLEASTELTQPWTTKTTEIFLKSWIIWMLFMAPVVFLTIWPSLALSKHVKFNLDSSPVGGRLSQAQAKGIDVFCSVIVAPMLVAAFDYAWFSAMRVVALNEQTLSKGAPLRALTTATGADSGSYNLVKTWTLLCSGRGVMYAFAALLLFSAATKSLFANIIAYEAYGIPSTVDLPSKLIGLANWSAVETTGFSSFSEYAKQNFGLAQREDYHVQFVNSFISLGYEQNRSRLVDGKYVTADCTKNSLAAIPADVKELLGVPGYQLSLNCKAEKPVSGPVFVAGADKSTRNLGLAFGDEGQSTPWTEFKGHLRGPNLHRKQDGYRPFVLHKFSSPTDTADAEVFIGALYSMWSNSNPMEVIPRHTEYGRLEPKFVNASEALGSWDKAWGDSPRYMAAFGLRCGILKETGHVTLQREANNNTWSARTFTSSSNKTASPPISLSIEDAGDMGPGFQWPSLGDLVGRVKPCDDRCNVLDVGNLDLDQTIANTLYAVGEADRIFYDVVAQANGTHLDYKVRGIGDVLWYRITYVPMLLLLAVLSCAVAGSIPAVLLLYNLYKASNAFWTWRAADPVRLVVDAVVGLREERSVVMMHGQSNEVIDTWGKEYCIRFVKRNGEQGVHVMLEPAGTKPSTDWLRVVGKMWRRKRRKSTSTASDT